ncbi:MAG: Threonine synthase [uncultured Sphingomonadaceae bacterium]|uniref:Threonine synthase n=1 Tax=uncultured Sphingomonadaceae bacterium TaxID=169976 RepID=A0A6J4TJ22_9SPHN|nr:MAG: Threonine synthase [uncultured Sphingomonadaceae bacterium]
MSIRYVSTRGTAPAVSLSEAIRDGVAPDGGLYLPEEIPRADLSALDGDIPLAAFAHAMLAPFFAGDRLEAALPAICAAAFDFPVPAVAFDPSRPTVRALELFHGPTGAFKDFGARFLMGCFERLGDPAAPLTVLVATSGDTGGAVGCAAEARDALRAFILYPRGRVSAFQEAQLGCWGAPVHALEVDGNFDDCQRLVKAAFADRELSARHNLTSANSINIARLLPQMAYLAAASMRAFADDGAEPGLVIPTGNLGHGFAAVYARATGFPIGPIVAATNANRTLHDWHRSGNYMPGPSVATIANAMDVGAPSNFERLSHMEAGARGIVVDRVEDAAIRARIAADFGLHGYPWCPHSAAAAEAHARLDPAFEAERGWLIAATAHPYKFADIVEPLTGRPVEPPPALARIADLPANKKPIAADLGSLRAALEAADR